MIFFIVAYYPKRRIRAIMPLPVFQTPTLVKTFALAPVPAQAQGQMAAYLLLFFPVIYL
jgi:hypothetical protein